MDVIRLAAIARFPSTVVAALLVVALLNPNLTDATRDGACVDSGAHLRINGLLAAPVMNRRGERLGVVEDIVVGSGGRIAFAVIAAAGIRGKGRRVAVPWAALDIDAKRIVLDVSSERFGFAPTLDDESPAVLAKPQRAAEVHRYFALAARAKRDPPSLCPILESSFII